MRRALGALGLTLMVAGCGGEPPRPAPSVPTFSTPSTTAAPTTTSGPPQRVLPVDCGTLLPTGQIDLVLGRPLVGRVQGITGIPEPAIRRLERFTCRYGLPEGPLPPGAPIPLEVSASVYADVAAAAERVTATVEAERARGAAPSTVPAGPVDATVLVSSTSRLLIAANGTVTVAISMAPGVADDRVNDVLSELAGRVLTTITS